MLRFILHKVYILFQLYDFFRDWQSRPINTGLCIIFIEEPEAHLHPQMQQVFIKQINEIALEFSNTLNNNIQWPVQFVVTTHSTHIANEANFESIRYFLTTRNGHKETKIKDLRKEFSDANLKEDKEFLHKYLTLTKCDLYFADKAILIEGPTERILMPLFIKKVDSLDDCKNKLSLQYLTVIEVGGAYAHHFYKFLDFLELRALIITDLDSAIKTKTETKTVYKASIVSKATHSTNTAISRWFNKREGYIEIQDCLNKSDAQKQDGVRRIAYQIPEPNTTICPRSFEDAFILANKSLFNLQSITKEDELAEIAYNTSPDDNKKRQALL